MIFEWKWRNGLVFGLESSNILLKDAFEDFIMHGILLHLGPLEFAWMWLSPEGEQ